MTLNKEFLFTKEFIETSGCEFNGSIASLHRFKLDANGN